MNILLQTLIVLLLVAMILFIIVLLKPGRSRFKNSSNSHHDNYRKKNEVGEQNLGRMGNSTSYRTIAKSRNLTEASKLEPKLNPSVTKAISNTSIDVNKDSNKGG